MLKPDEKKAFQAIGWLVNTFPQQLKEALIRNGYPMNGDNGLALRKKLIQGTLQMIKTGNKQFAEDVRKIVEGRKSNFDMGIITSAFSLLGNIFGSGQQTDDDVTNEIIALQAEREKAERMKTAFIFGGLAILGLVGIVVIAKATSK